MEQSSDFEKHNPGDKIMWKTNTSVGEFVFTFDGKKFYNMFRDYPNKLTPQEKAIFDRENPFWADYFSDRK